MNNNEIYERIEANIIDQLEHGIIPWRKCYHVEESGMFAVSHQSGQVYGLLNQFLLMHPGEYWTFNQAKKEGYHIRKGAKSRKIYFWRMVKCKMDFSPNEDETIIQEDNLKILKEIPMLKEYCVFHESDVDGLPPKPTNDPEDDRNKVVLTSAETIINNYAESNKWLSIIHTDKTHPCYVPSSKTIKMPMKSQFDSIEEYYSAFFHEMTHSTKVPLERKNDNYAREELVAELGAALLCGHAGISEEQVIQNSASYCTSWLKALKGNIKNLVWASSRADAAVEYILPNKKEKLNDASSTAE